VSRFSKGIRLQNLSNRGPILGLYRTAVRQSALKRVLEIPVPGTFTLDLRDYLEVIQAREWLFAKQYLLRLGS
jgi:hypothetical protein